MDKRFLRKWNTILHRDIGYSIIGLIFIYGISGIAVNHIHEWNPNYKQSKEIFSIPPITSIGIEQQEAEIIKKLQLEKPKNSFQPDSLTLQLFYEHQTYSIDIPTGNVLKESTQPRKVLYEMNQLHFNAMKGVWTYIADLFAVSLIAMAITGMFMLRGRMGISGRGKWFLAAGILIPLFFIVYYKFF